MPSADRLNSLLAHERARVNAVCVITVEVPLLEIENGGVDGLAHSGVGVLRECHQLESLDLLLHLLRGLDRGVDQVDTLAGSLLASHGRACRQRCTRSEVKSPSKRVRSQQLQRFVVELFLLFLAILGGSFLFHCV